MILVAAVINPPKTPAELRINDPILGQESQDTAQILQQQNQDDEHSRDSGASLYKVRRPVAGPSQALKLQPVRVESQAELDNLSCSSHHPVIQSYFKLNIVNLL